MNFMQNHTKIIIAMDCKTKVALIFMPYLVPIVVLQVGWNRPLQRDGCQSNGEFRRLTAQSSLKLTDKWIGEGEEQRNTHTDHRDRVEQCHNQEHLGLQHRSQFRLTRATFKEAATQQAHADSDAQCAETNQKCDSDRG